MAKALVTGGAGFIGGHIVRGLLARGDAVRVFDNFSSGKKHNLAEVAGDVEIIEGDIRDLDRVKAAIAGVDVVYHLAAMGSVPKSVDDPFAANDNNATGTLNVLIAARDANVGRVVYSSSSSAYGDTPTLPKIESMMPRPLSPYAVSKLAAEHYCLSFSVCYGLATVSLRYFNVFGPRQDPNSQYAAAIPGLCSRMLRGQPPIIFGDGEQTRDFCFVENVVEANLLGGTRPELRGEVCNIACGERISLNEIIKLLNQHLGTTFKPEYREPRTGDVKHSLADISEAKRVLGYTPKVMFAEGLKRSIDWYKANLR